MIAVVDAILGLPCRSSGIMIEEGKHPVLVSLDENKWLVSNRAGCSRCLQARETKLSYALWQQTTRIEGCVGPCGWLVKILWGIIKFPSFEQKVIISPHAYWLRLRVSIQWDTFDTIIY